MRKQPNKSQTSSRVINKAKKQHLEEIDEGLDDSSLDEIFRFDDKLIGKRTNTIFDVKPTNDGFFDIIQENFNSELSFESSNGDCEVSTSFDNLEISEMEEKKNQRMIRYIKESQTNDLLDASLMEIDEDDLTEDEDSREKEKQEKIIEPVKAKVIYKSAKGEPKANKLESVVDKTIPTAEKKSHIISVDDVPDMEKLNEAKSKARSQDNPKEANQKVQTSNQDIVKVEKKFQNKNQIQEKRKEEKGKSLTRKSEIQPSTKIQVQKEKKELPPGSNIQKPKEEKPKTLTPKFIESSKRRRQQDLDRRKRKHSPTPEAFKNFPKTSQRRVPRGGLTEEDEEKTIPKLKVNLNIERPDKKEEYEPFGRMGEEGRYPKRLRIPPLRFWNNERRHYERGMLSSITLIDDKRGNQVSKMIENQIKDADEV